MSDLFTVKLDLSSVAHNGNEQLYILLLDPTKMKMIYQFKLWIRFLFSINCSIKFVYEDAAIHDLEDTNILKLLKIVHVERSDPSVGEMEQQEEFIAKLNRYEEWRESVTPGRTPQRHCQLMNGDSFQTSSSQFHDLEVPKVKRNGLNLSNERPEKQVKCGKNENTLQYSPCAGSQKVLNMKIEKRNISKTKNDTCNTFNTSPTSLRGDEMEIENSSNKLNCQKHDTLHVAGTPESVAQSTKSSNETNKQQTSCKRISVHKPFSLYNFLQTLKGQESNFDETGQVKHDNTTEIDKNKIPEKKLNGEIYNNEDVEQFIKRKRKRIRKHKNQRFKANPQMEFYKETLSPPFYDKQKFMSASVSPKPKHIRFSADEDSRELSMNKPKQDESLIVKDHMNEYHYNSGSELSNDHKFDMILSKPEIDSVDEINNAVSVAVDINKSEQGDSELDFVSKDVAMADNDEEVKNESLSNSAGNILDILQSLRNKSNTPPVFDRFATYM